MRIRPLLLFIVYASSGNRKCFECGDVGHKSSSCLHKVQAVGSRAADLHDTTAESGAAEQWTATVGGSAAKWQVLVTWLSSRMQVAAQIAAQVAVQASRRLWRAPSAEVAAQESVVEAVASPPHSSRMSRGKAGSENRPEAAGQSDNTESQAVEAVSDSLSVVESQRIRWI